MTPEERRDYAAEMLAELQAFHEEVRARYGIMEERARILEEIRAERDNNLHDR